LDGHAARVAIIRAIAEVDPSAINDVVDDIDRCAVYDLPVRDVLAALARHALRSGEVAAGDVRILARAAGWGTP
jgi:hypothetical protein